MSNLTTKYSRIIFEKNAEKKGSTAKPDIQALIDAYNAVGKSYGRDFDAKYAPNSTLGLINMGLPHHVLGYAAAAPYAYARGGYSPEELYEIATDPNLKTKITHIPGYGITKNIRMRNTGKKLAKDPEALKAFIEELKTLTGKYEVEH